MSRDQYTTEWSWSGRRKKEEEEKEQEKREALLILSLRGEWRQMHPPKGRRRGGYRLSEWRRMRTW